VREEPIVDRIEGTAAEAAAFLRAFFACGLAAAAAVVGVSIWSNHFGDFGEAGQYLIYNDRRAKSEFLVRRFAELRPEAWVIGSSNTMPFLPSAVEERFGLRAFNLGVYWGRVEDSWAWVNFLTSELGARPRMILLGIEPWTFGAEGSGPPLFRRYRRRLLNAPLLRPYVDGYTPSRHLVSKLVDPISVQNLRSMLKATRKHRGRRFRSKPLEESGFLVDGTRSAYNQLAPAPFLPEEVNALYAGLASGKLDPSDPEVRRRRRDFLARGLVAAQNVSGYVPGGRVDSQSMETFRRVVALCQEYGAEIGIVVLPVHPYFYDLLSEQARHREHLRTVLEFTDRIRTEFPGVRAVIDASHIERFGGSPYAFHDHMHMTPENTAKVLDLLWAAW
jgi:hypothetical protein